MILLDLIFFKIFFPSFNKRKIKQQKKKKKKKKKEEEEKEEKKAKSFKKTKQNKIMYFNTLFFF
jgi:chromatin remodeling complex protein RSC6